MTSEIGEDFAILKSLSRIRRADNRENSAEYLKARGIEFVTNNMGVHLIVTGRNCLIDFWPGTGKWNSRCGKKGRGVRNLAAFIEASKPVPRKE